MSSKIQFYCLLMLVLCASACSETSKDYDSVAHCQALGAKPGTAEYDRCLKDEKINKMLEQQRKEFDQMKQDDLDRKLRSY